MSRRLIGGLMLTALLAFPASFPNPFKKKDKSPEAKTAAAEKSKVKEEAKGFDSTYAGGTVAYIPRYTDGKLDLSDRTSMRFQYGKPSWSLPYSSIKSIEVADRKPSKILQIPKFTKTRRMLTITFFNNKGRMGNLMLEVDVNDAVELLPLIEERSGKTVAVAGAIDPDAWWGDSIWRTPRNSADWEQRKAENKTAVAQAKE